MKNTFILHVSEGMLSDTISARTLILAWHHLRSCRCDPQSGLTKACRFFFVFVFGFFFVFQSGAIFLAICCILKLNLSFAWYLLHFRPSGSSSEAIQQQFGSSQRQQLSNSQQLSSSLTVVAEYS